MQPPPSLAPIKKNAILSDSVFHFLSPRQELLRPDPDPFS